MIEGQVKAALENVCPSLQTDDGMWNLCQY